MSLPTCKSELHGKSAANVTGTDQQTSGLDTDLVAADIGVKFSVLMSLVVRSLPSYYDVSP